MHVHIQFHRKTLKKIRVHMLEGNGRAPPPCRGGKEGGKGKRKRRKRKKIKKKRKSYKTTIKTTIRKKQPTLTQTSKA